MELEAADAVLVHQPPHLRAPRPRRAAGSMLANGISTSGLAAAAAATSSLATGARPEADS